MALVVVGFLMLLESMNIAKVSIGNIALDAIYPIFVIFSCIVIRSYKGRFGKLFGLFLFLWVFGGFFSIRIFHNLSADTPAKFDTPVLYEITGTKNENLTISTLVGNMDIEGNTKSPYLQGTRTSDRDMITSKTQTGDQETILIQDHNTLDLLENFISKLTLFVPSTSNFWNIYIKNARGKEDIETSDMHRKKLTLHGGINTIHVQIDDMDKLGELEIQWAIQSIVLTIPKDVGVSMKYRQLLGTKNIPNMQYQSWYLYTSTNINQAKKILNVSINVAVGKLVINRK